MTSKTHILGVFKGSSEELRLIDVTAVTRRKALIINRDRCDKAMTAADVQDKLGPCAVTGVGASG